MHLRNAIPTLAAIGIVCVVAIFLIRWAPQLHLGEQESFLLYRWFGVSRTDSIKALVIVAALAGIAAAILHSAQWLRRVTTSLGFWISRSRASLLFAVFLIAIVPRLGIVAATPSANDTIDLSIYVSAGTLVSRGIDPYDYNSGESFRRDLRMAEPIGYLSEDQGRWDYYVSANLPLTSLYWGAIDALHVGDVRTFHRIVYALADALAAVLVFAMVWFCWPSSRTKDDTGLSRASWTRLFAALLLGALSPLFITWSTIIPEDKGLQTLLMVAACLGLLSSRRLALVTGTVTLGLSIAFKAFGVFLMPAYFVVLWHRSFWLAVGACALALAVAAATFLFFDLHVLEVVGGRLISGTSGAAGHQALWVFVEQFTSVQTSTALRTGWSLAFVAVASAALVMRRLDVFSYCAILLFTFTIIMLKAGSPDRMAIAVMVSICMLGIRNPSDATWLAWLQAALFGGIYAFYKFRIWGDGWAMSQSAAFLVLSLAFSAVVVRRLVLNVRRGTASEVTPDRDDLVFVFPWRSLRNGQTA